MSATLCVKLKHIFISPISIEKQNKYITNMHACILEKQSGSLEEKISMDKVLDTTGKEGLTLILKLATLIIELIKPLI